MIQIIPSVMHREIKYIGKLEFIKIIDEDGDQYECQLAWSLLNRDTYVTGEVGRFFRKNGLKEGSKIVIGVDLCYLGWWYAKVIFF